MKNVHLCVDWLAALEKRLLNMVMDKDFRLFLTCEIHPKLPQALLRGSEVIVYEASTGVYTPLIIFLLISSQTHTFYQFLLFHTTIPPLLYLFTSYPGPQIYPFPSHCLSQIIHPPYTLYTFYNPYYPLYHLDRCQGKHTTILF